MSDVNFEVCLNLNAHSHANTPTTLKRRLNATLACFRKQGPTEYKIFTPTILNVRFHCFRARVASEFWDANAIFDLSKRIQQDSISVYSPLRDQGAVIGPRADRWGAFKKERFGRFDPAAVEAARIAALAGRPDPTKEMLRAYALKAFTEQELVELDFRPRNHFFGLLFRRLKNHDLPPSDAELVGLRELAIEHCWGGAMLSLTTRTTDRF